MQAGSVAYNTPDEYKAHIRTIIPTILSVLTASKDIHTGRYPVDLYLVNTFNFYYKYILIDYGFSGRLYPFPNLYQQKLPFPP